MDISAPRSFQRISMRSATGRWVLVVSAVLVKIAASVYAVHSDEFQRIVKMEIPLWEDPEQIGPRSPWTHLAGWIYSAWKLLPLEHPDVQGAFTPYQPSLEIGLLVVMLKLPFIIFDILTALVVYLILHAQGAGRKSYVGSLVWLWNPYALLLVEMQGSVDIVPTFFMMVSMLMFLRRRLTLSGALLAAGAALKFFPILALPMYGLLVWREGSRRQLTNLVIVSLFGVLLYGLWVTQGGYGLISYMVSPFVFHFGEVSMKAYPYVGLATFFTSLFCLMTFELWGRGVKSVVDAVLGMFLAYTSFATWYPQNLLWILPLMTLGFVSDRRSRAYGLAYLIVAFLNGTFVASFFAGGSLFFVMPEAPYLQSLAASLQAVASDPMVGLVGSPASRSILAGIGVFYSLRLLYRNSPRLQMIVRHGTDLMGI